MESPLLSIKNLIVKYKSDREVISGVNDISLSINKGESLGVIGESGSGKTSLAMAIMGLIKGPSEVKGNIFFKGRDINGLDKDKLNTLRWKKIAIVFQNSLDILNPLLTIHEQIYEVLIRHTDLSIEDSNERINELLLKVGLTLDLAQSFPHELSGGMRQRVLIAMALSCQPELLIVDEPTSSLDMVAKNEIISLLSELYKENKFALLVISHELDTVLKLTSNISVMYSGTIVERGKTKEVIANPMHVYTKGLLNSSPAINPFGDMWGIPNKREKVADQGCPFENRCTQGIAICKRQKPKLTHIAKNREVACHRGGIVTILQGKNISKTFKTKHRKIAACTNCDIEVKSGEVVALIGESGSGKTTLASILAGMLKADDGQVLFEQNPVIGNNYTSRINGIQMVLQDPFSAINENLSVREAISEPKKIIGKKSSLFIEKEVQRVLVEVQLPNDDLFMDRKCFSLSGGQLQRVSLARSLMVKPKLLIADEISSMLDPSTQANILRLLKKLQNEKGFSMLYITHDLAVARKIADRVYVMSQGKIVEDGMVSKVFSKPSNEYTQKLIGESLSTH